MRFLAASDAAFETILPALFFVSLSFVSPETVFTFVPENTADLARFPLAIFETRFAFMTFMTFMAFMAFMAFIAFIAFIASAMATGRISHTHDYDLRRKLRLLMRCSSL